VKNKEFKFVFLPIALMVGALIFLFFYSDSENEMDIFKTAERSSVSFAVEMIQEDFSDAVSDLEILSASQFFSDSSSVDQIYIIDTIKHLFSHYLESKRVYESITFMDKKGMEKVRVNYNGGAPASVEEAELVSRADIDYFKEAVSIVAGQTYMTFPMDSTPKTSPESLDDMSIFFLAPVYNASSSMVGVVMIEYRLSTLSRRLMKIFANSPDSIMIVDMEGRWLLPPRSGRESEIVVNPSSLPIGAMFPEAWEKIRSSQSGQFINDLGLFTYESFYSPKAIHHHVISGEESRGMKAWKVISLVPDNMVNAQSRRLSGRLVILYAIFIIFIGITLKIQDRYSGTNGGLPFSKVSPIALMGVTVLIVFMSEFIVMLALQAAPQLGPLTEAAVDATLLSVLILPMISFLLIRPLADHIRARQSNEEKLKRSEENVKAIIKNAGEGIVVLDEKMRIQMVNEELLNIFGYSEDELTGEKITILSPVDPLEGREGLTAADSGPFRSLLTATGRRTKIMGLRKSGETFPMEARIEKTTTSDQCFYVGALRDITDREFALKALAESEEKFRSSFENAAIGMVLVDLDGKFLQVNGAFCSMVGYSKLELMSKTFSDITYPEDLAEDMLNVQRALRGDIDSFQMEKRYIHKNGETIWVLLNAALVRETGHEPRFFIAQTEDITDRKKTELALIGAKEDAEESNLLKDKFVSLVAHDLRSPFVSISGLLSLMVSEEGGDLSERHSLMLKTALNASEQSVGLIDELLNISRLKTGVITPRRRFLDAYNIALMAIASLSHIAARKNVVLENLVPERTRIFADPRLYTEVITNLLNNAIKFSHSGSKVRIIATGDGKAGLAVLDHGVGVRMEYIDKLFRYDEKTHTRGTLGETGTGLGLPLSYDIMLAHGGTLECSAPENGGSLFVANLPNITPRILVVEKDQEIAHLMELALAEEVVEFLKTADFGAAKAILNNNFVHMIIADLEYDPGAGLEFIKSITSKKEAREIPVLAITAHHQTNEAEKALNAGAADFVTKPLDMEAMIARARRIII